MIRDSLIYSDWSSSLSLVKSPFLPCEITYSLNLKYIWKMSDTKQNQHVDSMGLTELLELLGVHVEGKCWQIAIEKIDASQPEPIGSPTTMVRNGPQQWELPIASHLLSHSLSISDFLGILTWECYPLWKTSMTEIETISCLCLKA